MSISFLDQSGIWNKKNIKLNQHRADIGFRALELIKVIYNKSINYCENLDCCINSIKQFIGIFWEKK